MGVQKKRVATYVMIVVTVIWIVALCIHVQGYIRYVQETREFYEAHGVDPRFLDLWPLPDWGAGPNLGISGLIILGAWIVSYSFMRLRDG